MVIFDENQGVFDLSKYEFLCPIYVKIIKFLKYGFCKKLLPHKWNSDQLNTFDSLFFQISADLGKKWGQKGSTGQRFICTEVTSYKIHILSGLWIFTERDVMEMHLCAVQCMLHWATTEIEPTGHVGLLASTATYRSLVLIITEKRTLLLPLMLLLVHLASAIM